MTDIAVEPTESNTQPKPWLLGVLCTFLLMLPAEIVPSGPLKSYGSPAKLLALLAFGLVSIGLLSTRRSPRYVRPGAFILLTYFFLFLATYAAGLAQLSSDYTADNRTRALVALVANVGAGLYALARTETANQRDFVLGCIAVGLSFNCLVGILQSTTGLDLRTLLQPPGFVENLTREGTGVVLSERFGAIRATGTSGHAIEFSVLAALTVPLALYFARFAQKRYVRRTSALAVVLGVVAVVAGVSRSGALALCVSLGVMAMTYRVKHLISGLLVGAGLLWIQFSANPVSLTALWTTITTSEEDLSIQARLADYATVSQTLRQHPLFGLGLGGNPPAEYGFLDNQWLQALVQGGMVGLVAMTIAVVGALFGVAASLRLAENQKERAQAYTAGAMLGGIIASSFTFDSFAVSYQQVAILFFILLAISWSPVKLRFSEGTYERAPSLSNSRNARRLPTSSTLRW